VGKVKTEKLTHLKDILLLVRYNYSFYSSCDGFCTFAFSPFRRRKLKPKEE